MNQQEVNEQVGKKIISLAAQQMGEAMMEVIRLRAANEVLSQMISELKEQKGDTDGGV